MKEVPGVALNRLRGRPCSLCQMQKASSRAASNRAQKATSDHLATQSHSHVAQRADGAAQRECVGHRPRARTAPGVAVTLRRDGTRAGERHDGDWYHLFIAARTFRMCLVSIILVSQKRMQLRCTRMGERRWQHSRSQVRQRRQCLWAAPTRHAAAPDAQPCAAGDPRARAALWALRQAVRGVRSCAALLIGSGLTFNASAIALAPSSPMPPEENMPPAKFRLVN